MGFIEDNDVGKRIFNYVQVFIVDGLKWRDASETKYMERTVSDVGKRTYKYIKVIIMNKLKWKATIGRMVLNKLATMSIMTAIKQDTGR